MFLRLYCIYYKCREKLPFLKGIKQLFLQISFLFAEKRGYGPTCGEVDFRNLIDFYGDNLFGFVQQNCLIALNLCSFD